MRVGFVNNENYVTSQFYDLGFQISSISARSELNEVRFLQCAAVASGKKQHTVTLLPGDGIGPEVISVAKNVLNLVASREGIHFDFQEMPVGGCTLYLTGVPLPEEALNASKNSDGVLLGAIGGNEGISGIIIRRI